METQSGPGTPSNEATQAQALVASLVGLMELEAIEVDLFRGPITSEPWTRVFGGR